MASKVKITTLIENTALGYDLVAEHGLSFWIEYNGKNILFDTGQTGSITKNAKILGIDLATTDAIIISHGHYDHTGGLNAVLSIAEHANIYMHPAAVNQKFSMKASGTSRSIGIPTNIGSILDAHTEANKVIWTQGPTEILPGLFVTGQVPRAGESSAEADEFFLDADCAHPDDIDDDQTLFFETESGIVVVFGCAHAGIYNILKYIVKLAGTDNIHAVMGGMHLLHASDAGINRAIKTLSRYDIQKFGPAHCTGLEAAMKMRESFPKKCFMCSVGTTIEF